MWPFYLLGFRVLGKKNGPKTKERKKRSRRETINDSVDALLLSETNQIMSERKSARRAPTPKRFADEDVEKKPARKSTSLPGLGKSGGSKVVRALVFITPFRKMRKPPLSSFLVCEEFENFLSRARAIFEDSCVVVVVVGRTRPFSIANYEARVSLSLFSSLPMEMFSLTFSRWWWW